ncbi:hypothetical protein W97_03574 [Coniosporium apollinis CBS 100218]|uniref:Uncharacterized protein n=1 Tax=Coniosporium apollinis (strain CBS 100218) TaxID=1168221 RepID=R7YR51_CONA1|nr:uncharacterized protein W97_03574 [Coniosporium apollinis CBS 100218]EON64343.1 hypothetical protein W97_03574 [Coniosporium apollinis CBS 100218]
MEDPNQWFIQQTNDRKREACRDFPRRVKKWFLALAVFEVVRQGSTPGAPLIFGALRPRPDSLTQFPFVRLELHSQQPKISLEFRWEEGGMNVHSEFVITTHCIKQIPRLLFSNAKYYLGPPPSAPDLRAESFRAYAEADRILEFVPNCDFVVVTLELSNSTRPVWQKTALVDKPASLQRNATALNGAKTISLVIDLNAHNGD